MRLLHIILFNYYNAFVDDGYSKQRNNWSPPSGAKYVFRYTCTYINIIFIFG